MLLQALYVIGIFALHNHPLSVLKIFNKAVKLYLIITPYNTIVDPKSVGSTKVNDRLKPLKNYGRTDCPGGPV